MLMTLGFFGFETRTAPYASMARTAGQRWAETQRLGNRPADQDLGPGAETLTLQGVLRPELTGGPEALDRLREMMRAGKAWPLVSGRGEVMGRFVILSIDQTQSDLRGDGRARSVAFTVALRRYWGDPAGFGHLPDSDPDQAPTVP